VPGSAVTEAYASAYNYEDSLADTHIVHENASQSTNSTSISETSSSRNENNFDSPVCPQIDPKIVPSSQIAEHQEESSSNHKCPYCDIQGYGMGFNNTDLLEKHVIKRHPNWTAYPGPPDLEKYKRDLMEKG
jgi:hypothetical protein